MWGAIIGDLFGSTYEYDQFIKTCIIDTKDINLNNSFYSDDTILTIAVLDALLNDRNYEYYLKKYGFEYLNYRPNYEPYFKSSFSPGFVKWINDKTEGKSCGNGAMMRISPIGYLCNNEEDLIDNVIKATSTSHNSTDAIECSTVVAMIIYLARKGFDKEEIINKLNLSFSYSEFKSFNTTCSETINNCLYALFNSDSYIESVKTVISYGGDTDTNACIVGSMAEALYGIDSNLIEIVRTKLPDSFIDKLDKGYSLIKK